MCTSNLILPFFALLHMSQVSMCTSYSKSTPFSSCYTFLRNPRQLTSKDLDDVATVNQESCNSVHLFPAVLWKCICKRRIFWLWKTCGRCLFRWVGRGDYLKGIWTWKTCDSGKWQAWDTSSTAQGGIKCYLPTYQSIYLSIYLSVYLPTYLSIHLSFYLSIIYLSR